MKIVRIREYLDKLTMKCLVHAFVMSRQDCCNSLLSDLPESDILKLRRIQTIGRKTHLLSHTQRTHYSLRLLTPFVSYSPTHHPQTSYFNCIALQLHLHVLKLSTFILQYDGFLCSCAYVVEQSASDSEKIPHPLQLLKGLSKVSLFMNI